MKILAAVSAIFLMAAAAAPGDSQVAAFAAQYGVTQQDVMSWRHKGMGWGELGIAFAIAEKSGKPMADIIYQRESGEVWGAIAKSLGFKLKDVRERAKAIAAEGRQAERADKEARKALSDPRPPGAVTPSHCARAPY